MSFESIYFRYEVECHNYSPSLWREMSLSRKISHFHCHHLQPVNRLMLWYSPGQASTETATDSFLKCFIYFWFIIGVLVSIAVLEILVLFIVNYLVSHFNRKEKRTRCKWPSCLTTHKKPSAESPPNESGNQLSRKSSLSQGFGYAVEPFIKLWVPWEHGSQKVSDDIEKQQAEPQTNRQTQTSNINVDQDPDFKIIHDQTMDEERAAVTDSRDNRICPYQPYGRGCIHFSDERYRVSILNLAMDAPVPAA